MKAVGEVSELYISLRSRIQEVASWTYLDSDTMREARERLGLSYEAVAKQLPVVGKTIERWEKQGRVPTDLLGRYATVVGLRIETNDPVPVPIQIRSQDEEPDFHTQLVLIDQRLGRVEAGIQALLDADRVRRAVR